MKKPMSLIRAFFIVLYFCFLIYGSILLILQSIIFSIVMYRGLYTLVPEQLAPLSSFLLVVVLSFMLLRYELKRGR